MRSKSQSTFIAMCSAAAVIAQFIGGKATRDALFLTSLDATALPAMLIATSVFSIFLVGASARWSARVRPAVFVPLSFLASAFLYLCEYAVRSLAPSATAIVVYLHVSGVGPLLASGFWLIASELFDPRSAKQDYGRIGGAGTLGGLAGAILSERVAALFGVPAMLLVLAALQILTAWAVRNLALASEVPSRTLEGRSDLSVAPTRSGLATIAERPHLRNLAALVLLGTTSAALLEYLFKVKAVEAFGPGDHLLRFFAAYYAVTSFLTFLLQTSSTTAALQRFGLGLTTSTPSIAILAGSLGGLIVPGFGAMVVARAAEAVFRSSWFRTGYELFYTPVSSAEKRGSKPLIDVAVDRLGDAVGGGIVRLAVVFLPAAPSTTILGVAMLISLCAIIVASRLNRWYIRGLETSLVARGGAIDLPYTEDYSMHSVVAAMREVRAAALTVGDAGTAATTQAADPELDDIVSLRSRERNRVLAVLSRENNLGAAVVPHVIPLLAWDPVADYALVALRKVAEERIGELTDALLDPNQDDMVRRRLARVFSVAVSQRAADGLVLALDDARFDVRFQVARSLVAIVESNPNVHLNAERVYQVVQAELAVGRPVWESRRLLDGFVSESPLDEYVRDRAGQSLAHVFTLLSLVLPRQPLNIAFRSLTTGDRQLQGTALEYLENVLPGGVKQALWPYLMPSAVPVSGHQHERTIASLLQSSASVTVRSIARDLQYRRLAGFGRA
jgi:ATP:ADP antiporter, AAA family